MQTGWHRSFGSAANANIHGGVSRESDVEAADEKVHVDRPAAAVGAHQDGQGVRAYRQPHNNANR